MYSLRNKHIAILAEDGFEESELISPKEHLEANGATVTVVSPREKIRSWKDDNWNLELDADEQVNQSNPNKFDGLVIPGGVANPDLLRDNQEAIEFVNKFFETGKPIAAICHGPQVLIETGALRGRKVTSTSNIRTDLENAGAEWVDEPVVVDSGLVTSRTPQDLNEFNTKMIEEFAEGIHEGQRTI